VRADAERLSIHLTGREMNGDGGTVVVVAPHGALVQLGAHAEAIPASPYTEGTAGANRGETLRAELVPHETGAHRGPLTMRAFIPTAP